MVVCQAWLFWPSTIRTFSFSAAPAPAAIARNAAPNAARIPVIRRMPPPPLLSGTFNSETPPGYIAGRPAQPPGGGSRRAVGLRAGLARPAAGR